jgi:hypothetical protein
MHGPINVKSERVTGLFQNRLQRRMFVPRKRGGKNKQEKNE